MENTQINSYDAAFKHKAIDLAWHYWIYVETLEAAAGRIDSMPKKQERLSEDIKADGLNLKIFLRTGWTHKGQVLDVYPLWKSGCGFGAREN